MRTSFFIAGLAIATMLSLPAFAFQDRDVTIAYADGYTGTDGQFHAWEHRSDAEGFRAQHADKYRPWRHDDPRHKNDH